MVEKKEKKFSGFKAGDIIEVNHNLIIVMRGKKEILRFTEIGSILGKINLPEVKLIFEKIVLHPKVLGPLEPGLKVSVIYKKDSEKRRGEKDRLIIKKICKEDRN